MNTADLVKRDGITAASQHLGLQTEPGDRPWLHDAWSVTLALGTERLTVPYRTGIGHRSKRPIREHEWNNLDRRLLVAGSRPGMIHDRPIPPDAASALDCLLSDASSAAEAFEDWCRDLGYDSDSRKALSIYLECQKVASDLRTFLGAKFAEYMEAERL